MIAILRQHARCASRELRGQHRQTFLTVLTLTLAIGASTIVFSAIRHVLLDPVPYRDAHGIYVFRIRDLAREGPGGRWWFQVPEFLGYQARVTAFEDVMADSNLGILHLTDEGTEPLAGASVSGNAFRFLGVEPALGRTLTDADAQPGAPPVFVMSYRMWARYGFDPDILGRSFVFNDESTTLVGIMPPRFQKLGADVWLPAALDRADPSVNERFFYFHARLRPGVSLRQAEIEFQAAAEVAAQDHPQLYPERFAVEAMGWVDLTVRSIRPRLITMAAAVALLVLIACGNVANMLLVRAAAREREMAIRAALGATRARIIGQLLTEGFLVALLSAAAGCMLAYIGLKALVTIIPAGAIPQESVIRMDTAGLFFALVTACGTVLVFGLIPALYAVRLDLVGSLKAAGNGLSPGMSRGRLGDGLVVAEVTLAIVLLAGAGLLMRTFVNLTSVELGFQPASVEYLTLSFPRGQYQTALAKHQLVGDVMAGLRSRPEVSSVAAAAVLAPFIAIRADVGDAGAIQGSTSALMQLCSEGYFTTLDMPLLRGRPLSRDDVARARHVVVVNETFARRHLGNGNPIGQRVTLGPRPTLPDFVSHQFEVVGVVADAKNRRIQDPTMPQAFVPISLTSSYPRTLLVKTSGTPLPLASVRRLVWALDRNIAVSTGTLSGDMTGAFYAGPRFALVVLGVFAGVGLTLASLGVYGVIGHVVAQRRREIGIRLALGAPRATVFLMVFRQAAQRVGLGLIAGLIGAGMFAHGLTSQLWGVTPLDPLTLSLVCVVLVVFAGLACYYPARRASRVDPIRALRTI